MATSTPAVTTAPTAAPAAAPAAAASLSSFPVIDLGRWLNRDSKDSSKSDWEGDCKTIADCLFKYGCLVIRDPRVDYKENDVFIDLMETYYERPKSEKLKDARPDVYYQVGSTPDGIENARDHTTTMVKLGQQNPADKPLTKCPPDADPKWRFFWRMGEQPPVTEFKALNAPQVVPMNLPNWEKVMNTWGGLILGAVGTVAEMAAVGFGLPVDTFTKLMKYGPHLLAPTGGDLGHSEYGKIGTVFANFHYDLNFMSIHGKSRFPGLYVWTREGTKMPVKMPEGCLLIQAGKQFEWLTGGHVLAGFHEVVVSQATIDTVAKAKKEGRSCWRVSSTLFAHVASDQVLQPLGTFDTPQARIKYPPTKAGHQVQEELNQIKLGKQARDKEKEKEKSAAQAPTQPPPASPAPPAAAQTK